MPSIFSEKKDLNFESCLHLMQFLQDLGENNALLQTRKGIFKDLINSTLSIYDNLFKTEDNNCIQATFEEIYFIGNK